MPWPLYPQERNDMHCIMGWVGPRVDLDIANLMLYIFPCNYITCVKLNARLLHNAFYLSNNTDMFHS